MRTRSGTAAMVAAMIVTALATAAVYTSRGTAAATTVAKITFVDLAGSPQLRIVNPDGTGNAGIPNAQGEYPRLSPDGQWVAFENSSQHAHISKIRPDGTGGQDVTPPSEAGVDAAPSWSPDGSKIVFYRIVSDSDTHIWVVNADGSGAHQLTATSQVDTDPRYSPDGSKIVFSRGQPATSAPNPDIWIMNADGTGQQQLTEGGDYSRPVFSPDGSKVVMIHNLPSSFDPNHVWIMNVDGSGQEQLTSMPNTIDDFPSFSPDGQLIAFLQYGNGGGTTIWTMNADGTNQQTIVSTGAPATPSFGALATSPPSSSSSSSTSSTASSSTSTSTSSSSSTSTTVAVTRSPASASPAAVTAGGATAVSGGGFAANQTLQISLHSDPVALGTTKSDAAGNFTVTVTIPASTAVGSHDIVVSGPAPNGGTHEAVASVAIAAVSAPAGAVAATPTFAG